MKVLMVEPGKTPYEAEIEGGLNSLQAAVGGIIQPVYPYEDPVALICNDEGKLMGLPLNRALYDEDGNIYDIVAGNFLIVGLGEENFATLPADLMEKYRQQFEHPEQFIRIAGKILAVKQPVPSLEEQEAQRAQMAAQEALQEEIRLEDSTDLAFDLDVFFRQYSGDYADLYPDSHEEKERMAEELLSGQTGKIRWQPSFRRNIWTMRPEHCWRALPLMKRNMKSAPALFTSLTYRTARTGCSLCLLTGWKRKGSR